MFCVLRACALAGLVISVCPVKAQRARPQSSTKPFLSRSLTHVPPHFLKNVLPFQETQRLTAEPGATKTVPVNAARAHVLCIGSPVVPAEDPSSPASFLTLRRPPPPVPGISATPYEDNLRYFNIALAGPAVSGGSDDY